MTNTRKTDKVKMKSGKRPDSLQSDFGKLLVTKTEDKSKLSAYLSDVLGTRGRNRKGAKTLGDGESMSDDSLRMYVTNILKGRISNLSGPEKVDLMMNVINTSLILSEGFKDRLVDKARELLPSLAYRTIAAAIIEEGEGAEEEKGTKLSADCKTNVSESAEAFLRYFPGMHEGQESIPDGIWSHFLSSCEARDQEYVFRRLIRLGSDHCRKFVFGAKHSRVLMSGVQTVLLSKHSGELLKSLLMDEVAQSKDKPGSFFHATELGSLLAVNTVPLINIDQREYEPDPDTESAMHALLKTLTQQTGETEMIKARNLMEMVSKCVRINDVLGKALNQLLLSENASLQHSVLTWAATVLNTNSIRCTIANLHGYEYDATSSDSYMLNFCRMLLQWLESFSWADSGKTGFSYFSSSSCRLNLRGENCLCGAVISIEEVGQRVRRPLVKLSHYDLSRELTCLCHRAIGVCVLPAISRYDRTAWFLSFKSDSVPHLSVSTNAILFELHHETIMEKSLQYQIAAFYGAQCKHLLELLAESQEDGTDRARKAHQKALSQIPEFCLRNMAQWMYYYGSFEMHQKQPVPKELTFDFFIEFCIEFLLRLDLVRTPDVTAILVLVLNTFAYDEAQGRVTRRLLSKSKKQLGSALLRIYVDVAAMDSYPVDAIAFSAHRGRFIIGSLIQETLSGEELRALLSKEERVACEDFLSAILHEVVYSCNCVLRWREKAGILHEELMQKSHDPTHAKYVSEKKTKLMQYTLKMDEGETSLEKSITLLHLLATDEIVVSFFTCRLLSNRTAAVICWLITYFCNPDTYQKYASYFPVLNTSLEQLTILVPEIFLSLVHCDSTRSGSFLSSLVEHPSLCLEHLASENKQTGKLLRQHQIIDSAEIMQRLSARHSMKRAALMETSTSWIDRCLRTSVDEESLLHAYRDRLGPMRISHAHLKQSHSFRALLRDNVSDAASTVALKKETEILQRWLPFNLSSAMFVFLDNDRLDLWRCVISGPVGTPYSRGIFTFDIYCPDKYPRVPPLVKFLTTGFGMADFSPYLERNGRVCLSLLGTSTEEDDSGKWNASSSSVLMVLKEITRVVMMRSSLQFTHRNEHNCGDGGRHEGSRQFWEIQAMTVRHAMLEQLRYPPPEMETFVRLYFAQQREVILKQCAMWVQNCQDEEIAERLKWDVHLLYDELQASNHWESGGL